MTKFVSRILSTNLKLLLERHHRVAKSRVSCGHLLLCLAAIQRSSALANGVSRDMSSATPTDNGDGDGATCLPGDQSIHAAHISEVHNVPMRVLTRPIPSILDEEKVLSLMETIQDEEQADSVPPIDILWITGRQGGDYYYSFGGCHRYEAFRRLQRETIPCKLFRSTVDDLRVYLGSSTPDLL